MAIISVHPDEFADLVMAYLLDMTRDDSMLPDNPRFKKFIKIMGDRGMKTMSYEAFLEMNTDTRIKYKRMKDSITADGKNGTKIVISKGETEYVKEEVFDRELCKQIFRKVKDVRFRKSIAITEERLDKIIDFCVEQKGKHKEEQ